MTSLYRHNKTISQWSTGGAYLHFLYEMGSHKLVTGLECEFTEVKVKQIEAIPLKEPCAKTLHKG